MEHSRTSARGTAWERILWHGIQSSARRIGLAVTLTLSLLAASLAAEAQQPGKVYRIGFLRAGPPPGEFIEAFQQGLGARGYVDGRNVAIEYRSTDGSFDELSRLAAELVRLNVDVILASGAPAAFAARSATTKVPIVFVSVYDPVEIGW